MAKVTGVLSDYKIGHLVGLHPALHFQPSGAAVGVTGVFAPETVVVQVSATGRFEAELQPTTTLRPSAYYTVAVRWGAGRSATLPWKLSVPAAGGALADLLKVPANPGAAWADTTPPPEPTVGLWWLNPDTGDLKEWSA